MSNTWIHDDYRNVSIPKDTSLVIADPVYDSSMVNDLWKLFTMELYKPTILFMYPKDLVRLPTVPDQICFWIKPVSTKNTSKNYSNFVEAIAMRHVGIHHNLHWSNRTGIFTDHLLENKSHPWKKPYSLIERLVITHYPGYGTIYDPCAGSGTLHDVCTTLSIPSVSVEIDAKYSR
jgi:hypothetical protein